MRRGVGAGLERGMKSFRQSILSALAMNQQKNLAQQRLEQQDRQFSEAKGLKQQMINIYRDRSRLKTIASPNFSDDLFDFLPGQQPVSSSPAQDLLGGRPPLFEPRKLHVNAEYLRPIPRLMEDFRKRGTAQDLAPTPNYLGVEEE